MQEYVGDKLNRKVRSKNLHRTKKLIQDCDKRNNDRNNDVFAVTNANGMLKTEKSIDPMINRSSNLEETEDTLISVIDEFNNPTEKS